MKGIVPVLAAGSSFAICVLAGLALGVWVGARTGQALWGPIGLAAGFALGAYAAVRLFARSLQ